jgi:hypothetical protein
MHGAERARALDVVLVVAERDRAADAEHSDLAVARLRECTIVGDHRDAFRQCEARRLDLVVAAGFGARHQPF